LVAVGNTPLGGSNPPQFLNAEFNRVEWREDEAASWHEVPGRSVKLKRGATLRCRVSVGNTAEAAWLAPHGDGVGTDGTVFLRCAVQPSGKTIDVPTPARTPYLADVELGPFAVPLSEASEQTVTLVMATVRKRAHGSRIPIFFGQKRVIPVKGM
jgi:hypothetical protein